MVCLTPLRLGVIVVLCWCCGVAHLPAQTSCPTGSLSDYRLSGPVKLILVESSLALHGRRKAVGKLAFDSQSRVLEDAHGDAGEYQVFRYQYIPHRRDYEIEMFSVASLYKEKPVDLQRHLIRFDPQGRCIEERDIDTDGKLARRTDYEYQPDGAVQETDYDGQGKKTSALLRQFDSNQRILSERQTVNSSPEEAWSRKYRYDAQGNLTDQFSYRKGALEAHWSITYDRHQRKISSELVVPDPEKDAHTYGTCSDCGLSSGRTTYKYDDHDRLIEEQSFEPGGKLVALAAYGYDSHGNITRELHATGEQARTATFATAPLNTFSYDLHGNWTEQLTTSSQGAITSVIYRTITYR